MTAVSVADLSPGDLVRLDPHGGWREVGSVQIKYHVRIDGQLYYLDADQTFDVHEKRGSDLPQNMKRTQP